MNFQTVQSTVYITFVLMSTTVLCRDGAIVYKITNTNTNKGPPIITEGNSSTIIVQPRDNVELSCPIISTPPSLYEWYKENPYEPSQERIFGPSQLWQRFELTNQGHLKIRSVTHEDSGTYICKAVNGFGAKLVSTKLAVTGDDPFKYNLLKSSTNRRSNSNESISVPEINRDLLPKSDTNTVTKGSSIFLKCEAKGNPKPNITWFKGDKIVGESKDSVFILKLTNLMESDSGRYRCESVNIYGKDMYEVMIQVTGWHRGDEILELKPSNLTLFVGGSGNITCVARSESVFPWFFWLKKVENVTATYYNNRVMDNSYANINSNDTGKVFYRDGVYYKVLKRSEVKVRGKYVYSTELNLTNVSLSDAGAYYCAVLGLMGFNYSEARVFVNADPVQVAKTIMKKQKAAAVQWAILWVFAFLIIAVVLIFCLVRLYGCRSPLKKNVATTTEKRQRVNNKPSCPRESMNPQREAFQPLMHTSTPSSLYRKSQARTHYDVSLHSNSGAADSESCHCQCLRNTSAKPSTGLTRAFYNHRAYRPNHCHSPASLTSSSSSHEYTLPLPYLNQPVPPPSSESNFYEQRRIFHPNTGHYYYHHLRPSNSNCSDVSSLG